MRLMGSNCSGGGDPHWDTINKSKMIMVNNRVRFMASPPCAETCLMPSEQKNCLQNRYRKLKKRAVQFFKKGVQR